MKWSCSGSGNAAGPNCKCRDLSSAAQWRAEAAKRTDQTMRALPQCTGHRHLPPDSLVYLQGFHQVIALVKGSTFHNYSSDETSSVSYQMIPPARQFPRRSVHGVPRSGRHCERQNTQFPYMASTGRAHQCTRAKRPVRGSNVSSMAVAQVFCLPLCLVFVSVTVLLASLFAFAIGSVWQSRRLSSLAGF